MTGLGFCDIQRPAAYVLSVAESPGDLAQPMEADLIKTSMLRIDRIRRLWNMKARLVMMVREVLRVEAPRGACFPLLCSFEQAVFTAKWEQHGETRPPVMCSPCQNYNI